MKKQKTKGINQNNRNGSKLKGVEGYSFSVLFQFSLLQNPFFDFETKTKEKENDKARKMKVQTTQVSLIHLDTE